MSSSGVRRTLMNRSGAKYSDMKGDYQKTVKKMLPKNIGKNTAKPSKAK